MRNFIDKNKKIIFEILRFVIVGVLATLVDYLGTQLILMICPTGWTFYIITEIDLATIVGFIFGVIFNYILSISFVFMNVDKKSDSKTPKGFIKFVVLGVIGLFIGIAIMRLFALVWTDMENIWWQFLIAFVIKTGITLVYNYISRKIFIFKAPKRSIILT